MKTHFIALSAFILFASISCQQKIDVEKEQEAIKAVLVKSTQAWLERDFETISSTWVHDETIARLGSSKGRFGFTEGWEAQEARYKRNFENYPDPSPNREVFSNYRIKVYQESARVIFDKELRNENDELLNKAIHTAFLEKENGEWKIAYLSNVVTSSYEMANNNFETSITYHKLDPADIDMILTDDFIGRNEKGRHTWTKENHMKYWTKNSGMAKDTIYAQLAIGNWVATRFQRNMVWQGKDVEFEAMQFKRFEDGKIAEIWEYGDSRQID